MATNLIIARGGVEYVPPISLAGFALYLYSVYSAIYGIILFDEALLNFHYFGAVFVFIGVYLARKIN